MSCRNDKWYDRDWLPTSLVPERFWKVAPPPSTTSGGEKWELHSARCRQAKKKSGRSAWPVELSSFLLPLSFRMFVFVFCHGLFGTHAAFFAARFWTGESARTSSSCLWHFLLLWHFCVVLRLFLREEATLEEEERFALRLICQGKEVLQSVISASASVKVSSRDAHRSV